MSLGCRFGGFAMYDCLVGRCKTIPGEDMKRHLPAFFAALMLMPVASVLAQPDYTGIWSTTATLKDDPAWYAEDYFCFFGCTLSEYEMMVAMIVDPANDDKSLNQIRGMANARGAAEFASLLKEGPRALYAESVLEDQLDEVCLRYGHFGMAISVMPLRITDEGDHYMFEYETHDTFRPVYKRESAPPPPEEPSRLGYSVAWYDGDDFMVETTGVEDAPFFVGKAQGLRHSDQLRTIERYTLSDDGQTLDMIFTVTDPEVLKAPWVWVKKWRTSPDADLLPHGYDCSFVPGQR
jgi:hypothetical protein